MTDSVNPYQSPSGLSELSKPSPSRGLSIVRGLAYSALFAPIGFIVPLGFFVIISTVSWLFSASTVESPFEMFFDDWRGMLSPCIGISIVFAMSAFRNFTPALQFGYVRSLMYVGGCLIAGAFAAAFVTFTFGLENNSYNSDPWIWLKLLVALLVPVGYIFNVILNAAKIDAKQAAE